MPFTSCISLLRELVHVFGWFLSEIPDQGRTLFVDCAEMLHITLFSE
jgi:hypothetical protein